MRFGDRLRNLRLSREMTQQELADTLNISQSAVAAYEKNVREPNFAMIQRIADYFGVTLASMIPSERPTDEEQTFIVADAICSNVKLRMLFDKAIMMSDDNLDALLTVAAALSKGNP